MDGGGIRHGRRDAARLSRCGDKAHQARYRHHATRRPYAGQRRNVRRYGRCHGWLPLGFVPGSLPEYLPWLEEGFRRAGNGKSLRNFAIQASVHVSVDNDVKTALAKMKPEVALYVGGMGHRDKNFHKDMMIRRGFGDAAQKIQELFLAKRKDEAVAAVPDEFCDEMALVGPVARIRERYRAWADSGITGLTITTDQPEAMELMASLAGPVTVDLSP